MSIASPALRFNPSASFAPSTATPADVAELSVDLGGDAWPSWADEIHLGIATEGDAPDPASEAWWSGFQLGSDGIPANPPADYSPAEQAAFISGHEIGHAYFIESCERDLLEMEERLDGAFSDPWDLMNEAEQCEAVGSVESRRLAAHD